jgi:Ca2+/H+ antiporter, TMEM165/GDT1 family
VIGALLLVFGLQWLRKAILRSAGLRSLHDEAEVFAEQSQVGRSATTQTLLGLDQFGFVVSLKGVFLEGVEVVFIIITFGLSAKNMPVAIGAGGLAVVVVVLAARAAHAPLTRVPENTLKYAVALLLTTYGTFWVIEGLGVFRAGHEPLRWPGDTLALIAVLLGWLGLSRLLVRVFAQRRPKPAAAELTGEEVAR